MSDTTKSGIPHEMGEYNALSPYSSCVIVVEFDDKGDVSGHP